MANIYVITGGDTKTGFEAAAKMPKDGILLLSGIQGEVLEAAAAQLRADGYEVRTMLCDVAVRQDVHELCLLAKELGTVATVLHADALHGNENDPETVILRNAVGTKNINMEFRKYLESGAFILDVVSTDAYQLPGIAIHHDVFKLAEYQEAEFIAKMMSEIRLALNEPGRLAYQLSENFVLWYAAKCAEEYEAQGIRVAAVVGKI